MSFSETVRYDEQGLVPSVLQDHKTREVLLTGFMNREALDRTLVDGVVYLWSRSRDRLWLKGETSGRVLRVREVRPNCEMNSLLVLVGQALPGACHTGHSGCYYHRLGDAGLEEVSPPLFDPDDVYAADSTDALATLLGAYDWLAEQDLIAESGTSRALHRQGPDPLERLRDEWAELLGVLEGTHAHHGFEEDALLESYQALYWTCLHQVMCGLGGSTALARSALQQGYNEASDPAELTQSGFTASAPADRLVWLWEALGAACERAALNPEDVVNRDLTELRAREYMSGYFSGK